MGEPIRILQMIGSLNIGGSQSMIINLYKNIDRSILQFDFIIDHPMEIHYKAELLDLGARIYEMPTFSGRNYFQVKAAWSDFFANHTEYKILHSHVRSYASIFIPIAKKYGLVTIIHSHNTSNGEGIEAFVKSVLQYPLRFQADYFFGCSKEAGKWLFGEKIVRSSKYYMLKNAVDLDRFMFNQSLRKKYREQLDVELKTVYIHVGRFHEQKNHIFLLEIFKKIYTFNKEVVLILVGDGDLRHNIETKIKELELTDAVIMLGNRADVPELFQAADCMLFPSLWEGLPVVIVEAQAAGLPCIISNTISPDVVLSSLVHQYPLDSKIWVETINNTLWNRMDVQDNIRQAGFDIKQSANWISEFYLSNI